MLLLAAMLLVNLGVVVVVLNQGWLAKPEIESPAQVAQAEPASSVADSQSGRADVSHEDEPRLAIDDVLIETSANPAVDRVIDSASTQPLPGPAPGRLAEATPEADARDTDPSQVTPVETEPGHDFFGVPFFE